MSMLWYEQVNQGSGGCQPAPIERQGRAHEGCPTCAALTTELVDR